MENNLIIMRLFFVYLLFDTKLQTKTLMLNFLLNSLIASQ